MDVEMKSWTAVGFLLPLLFPIPALAKEIDYEALVVTEEGIGPVQLGMEVSKASESLGIDIEGAPFQYGDDRCSSYAFGESEYDWDIRFIVSKGRVGKVDIYVEQIRTSEGLGIGSDSADIRGVYGGDARLAYMHDPGESALRVSTGEDTYIQFAGPRPGEVTEGYQENVKPPRVIDRYSLGTKGVSTVEGCL